MDIHFIAIGGAVMHNLAICLKNLGHNVTGSDDVIFDPSKSNLEKNGLLPNKIGFYEENISQNLDAVILGMHAKPDNVELKKAQKLNIPIYSFPQFIYEQSKDKKRVVIAGSHGKTTTTAMIMHVLKENNFEFDYLVGSSLAGFELSVKLTKAPLIILEGDEYLSSPIDRTSKFHFYKPDITMVTGIAWDHVNVFPTWGSYVQTFDTYLSNLSKDATAILYQNDATLQALKTHCACKILEYNTPNYTIKNGITFLKDDSQEYALAIFGKHNLENLEGARLVCNELGISNSDFYKAISTFKGTARRLEKIDLNNDIIAFRDFAHSPSKLEATINSVKEQYPNKKLIACMELHTFSSTDATFLSEYKNTMQKADTAIIYMSEKAFAIKQKQEIADKVIKQNFNRNDIKTLRTPQELEKELVQYKNDNNVFLLMSSGSFDGLDFKELLGN
ncbi:MAG: peptidoglycan synthetase [Bacteroidetes bacterium]|nr:peptidoglycan synthetase [Bacteroidota bacterium]